MELANNKILIINTGGTFNKIYDEISGKLIVQKNNNAILDILKNGKIFDTKTYGLIYKDSLFINKTDRKKLKNYIQNSIYTKIIIIHGTDTMDKTALYLSKKIITKQIILTGSMKPFYLNQIEATSNLMMAYGFLTSCQRNGIYISMHGIIKKHNKITKDKQLGIFKCL
ncbi:asparaginase [hydrothermal vent metagenome]|uniref:Asparaginase n=1 Tax=hydrothermal vent metagenome TaxID=652676 RepID=A0A3B1E0R5_9ZZZZ